MTTDTPSSRDEEIPTSECCTCGYTWQTGQDGSHSCATQLKEQLIRLSAEREKEREKWDIIGKRHDEMLDAITLIRVKLCAHVEDDRGVVELVDEYRKFTQEMIYDRSDDIDKLEAALAERDKELAEVKASFESVANIANARGRKIGELETICLQKDNQVDTLRAQLLAAQTVNGKLRHALEELRAVVKGECPSLLNEDSGGDAKLDLMIEELLTSSPDTTLLDEVVELAEMAEAESKFTLTKLGATVSTGGLIQLRDKAIALLSRLRKSTRETEDKV